MVVTLKQFCEETGYPKKFIKNHAKTGLLPYIPCGRRYLFDMEKTLQRLETLRAVPIYTPKPQKERCRTVKRLPQGYTSRTERLKAMIKNRNAAGVAAPTAKK